MGGEGWMDEWRRMDGWVKKKMDEWKMMDK